MFNIQKNLIAQNKFPWCYIKEKNNVCFFPFFLMKMNFGFEYLGNVQLFYCSPGKENQSHKFCLNSFWLHRCDLGMTLTYYFIILEFCWIIPPASPCKLHKSKDLWIFWNVRNLLLSLICITFFFFWESNVHNLFSISSLYSYIWIKAIQRQKFPLHKKQQDV